MESVQHPVVGAYQDHPFAVGPLCRERLVRRARGPGAEAPAVGTLHGLRDRMERVAELPPAVHQVAAAVTDVVEVAILVRGAVAVDVAGVQPAIESHHGLGACQVARKPEGGLESRAIMGVAQRSEGERYLVRVGELVVGAPVYGGEDGAWLGARRSLVAGAVAAGHVEVRIIRRDAAIAAAAVAGQAQLRIPGGLRGQVAGGAVKGDGVHVGGADLVRVARIGALARATGQGVEPLVADF